MFKKFKHTLKQARFYIYDLVTYHKIVILIFNLNQVWLKIYWGWVSWGMIRWQFTDFAVELYSCTDSKYYTKYSGDVFTNVPDVRDRTWELSWTKTG